MGNTGGFSPFKSKYETLFISGDFTQFSECQVLLRKCEAPYWKLYDDGQFWFKPHIFSHDGLVAFDS